MSPTPEASNVYVACIEVEPLNGCQLNPEEYAGAAVRCYVPAADKNRADELLRRTLKGDRMKLVEVEFFVDIDSVEWENPDSEVARRLSNEAKETGLLVYGEFRAWVHEDDE